MELARLSPRVLWTSLLARGNVRRIVSNTGWLFFDRFLRLGFGLLVGVWVARYLGPEHFGVYNFALAFVALFGPLAALGLENIIVRDLVAKPEDSATTLGSALFLRLIAGIGASLVSIYSIRLVRPHDPIVQVVVAILATSFVFQACDVIDYWFQSQVRSKYVVWARIGAFLAASISKVLLIILHAPLVAFAWVALAESALSAFGLVYAYRLNGSSLGDLRAVQSRLRSLIKDSWPLMFSGIAIIMYMRIGQIMLGKMVNDEAVGVYAAAVRLAEMCYMIPMVLMSSLTPGLIRAHSQGELENTVQMQRVFNFMVQLALVISIPLILLASPIVRFLYGQVYEGAVPILQVYLLSNIFVFIGVARGPWLISENLTMVVLCSRLIGACANVFLNLFLIPRFGGIGSAIATVIAECFALYVSNLFFPSTRAIFFLQTRAILTLGLLARHNKQRSV